MALVSAIQIDSTITPTITIDKPLEPSQTPGILDWIKPKITIYSDTLSDPVVSQPYGDPGASKWPLLVAGMAGILALAAIGATSLITGRRR